MPGRCTLQRELWLPDFRPSALPPHSQVMGTLAFARSSRAHLRVVLFWTGVLCVVATCAREHSGVPQSSAQR